MAPDDRRRNAARTHDRAAHHFGPRASNARTELDLERPFAELDLNSVMAMSIRREAERLVGMEWSLTMLWNHPTIASLTEFLAELSSPQEDLAIVNGAPASASSMLDALFDSVESAS
jgi:phthiocerol/phenolphthiocerol synthesis type-I polyketide synthase A